MTKTISVPGSLGRFEVRNSIYRPGRGVIADVRVTDDIDDEVAFIAVYENGDAETRWRSGDDAYGSRPESWWASLCAEVAKAVAS
jgi:hypothetical protein